MYVPGSDKSYGCCRCSSLSFSSHIQFHGNTFGVSDNLHSIKIKQSSLKSFFDPAGVRGQRSKEMCKGHL